jgi:hypothetical protein
LLRSEHVAKRTSHKRHASGKLNRIPLEQAGHKLASGGHNHAPFFQGVTTYDLSGERDHRGLNLDNTRGDERGRTKNTDLDEICRTRCLVQVSSRQARAEAYH